MREYAMFVTGQQDTRYGEVAVKMAALDPFAMLHHSFLWATKQDLIKVRRGCWVFDGDRHKKYGSIKVVIVDCGKVMLGY